MLDSNNRTCRLTELDQHLGDIHGDIIGMQSGMTYLRYPSVYRYAEYDAYMLPYLWVDRVEWRIYVTL